MSLIKKKAKTRRGKKALERRAPLVNENVKSAMFLRGPSTDATIVQCLKDLAAMKKPDCFQYSRKTDVRPFVDETSLQYYARKSDCSLFAYGSSSKKRPSNLILGRLHNYEVLDMVEFGVEQFRSLTSFSGQNKSAVGSKPCFVLDGPLWTMNERFELIGNLIVDFFRGVELKKVNLAGLDHVIVLSVVNETKILFRHYGIVLKKSGTKVPRVELEEIGPHFDLTLRREQMAPESVRRVALRVPQEVRGKKRKNVTTNVFGEQIGRIHMPRQDLGTLRTNITKQDTKRRKKASAQQTKISSE